MEIIKASLRDCIHCLQPVNGSGDFCCSGCEAAHGFISASGLQDFYKLRANRKLYSVSSELPAEFLDIEYAQSFVFSYNTDLKGVCFMLEGITCSACVWLLEKIPFLEPRVKSVRVAMGISSVEILFDSQMNLSELAMVFVRLGYKPHLYFDIKKDERKWILRVAVAFASWLATMHISLNLYAGLLSGMSENVLLVTALACFVLALPAIIYSAQPFYTNSLRAIKGRRVNIDILVSLTVILGTLQSLRNIFLGMNETYFEALTMLIAFLLIGRLVVHYVEKKTQTQGALFKHKILGAQAKHKVGEVVSVKSGESFPCDGVVESGRSYMDSSWLTGEEEPLLLNEGKKIFAGAINMGDVVKVKIQSMGYETLAGKVLMALQTTEKSQLSLLSEKFERYFVYFVIFALPLYVLLNGGSAESWSKMITLMLVICPCALGLAVPMVVTTAMAQAAQLGILMKGEKVLEKISFINTIVFDKTGTLTDSKQKMTAQFWNEEFLNKLSLSKTHIEKILSQCAHRSVHPTLRPFRKVKENDFECNFREILGSGVEAKCKNHQVKIGSVAFLKVPQNHAYADCTLVVEIDGLLVAGFKVRSVIREEATSIVLRLMRYLKIYILSGDQEKAVEEIGKKLKIPQENVFSAQTPQMKLDFITRLSSKKKVMMVGDGVNDTLAFKKSHVSVGVSGGAALAMQTCDVYLTNPNLGLIERLMKASYGVVRVIKLNMVWVLVYNIIGFALVFRGVVGPLACAVLMPLSSITVVLFSTMQNYFKEPT